MLIPCKECGHMISDKAEACPKCGCPVDHEEMDPSKSPEGDLENSSDSSNSSNSSSSSNSSYQMNYEYMKPAKDKAIAAILAIFLGCWGIHHFYLGNNDRGISYLVVHIALIVIYFMFGAVTFGFFLAIPLPALLWILCIVDAVHYLGDNEDQFKTRIENEKQPVWSKVYY